MDQTKRLNNAYKAQNLDEMLKLMEERDGNSCDPQPGEMEDLLDNRNKAWIEKMPSIMKRNPYSLCSGCRTSARNKWGIEAIERKRLYSGTYEIKIL